MSKQPIELVKIKLMSTMLLHYMIPNNNTQMGMCSVVHMLYPSA